MLRAHPVEHVHRREGGNRRETLRRRRPCVGAPMAQLPQSAAPAWQTSRSPQKKRLSASGWPEWERITSRKPHWYLKGFYWSRLAKMRGYLDLVLILVCSTSLNLQVMCSFSIPAYHLQIEVWVKWLLDSLECQTAVEPSHVLRQGSAAGLRIIYKLRSG